MDNIYQIRFTDRLWRGRLLEIKDNLMVFAKKEDACAKLDEIYKEVILEVTEESVSDLTISRKFDDRGCYWFDIFIQKSITEDCISAHIECCEVH